MKKHLASLSKEQMRKRMENSALSVPRWNAGKHLPEEMRKKIAKGVKMAFADGYPLKVERRIIYCDECGNPIERKVMNIGKLNFCSRECCHKNIEFRKQVSETVKKLWETPEYKKKQENRIQVIRSTAFRRKVSIGVKRWYEENPEKAEELIRKISLARKHKPNKLEQFFDHLLQRNFNGQFRYVGDGYTFIGKKNPDFVDFKNRRIIELFGNYWHKQNDEEELKQYYWDHGNWDMLVIWEHELTEPEEVIEKVREFVEDV